MLWSGTKLYIPVVTVCRVCTKSQHLLSYFDDRDRALKYHEPLASRNRSPFKWWYHHHRHKLYSECCNLVQNSTYQSSPYVGFCTRSQHLLSYFDDRDKALKYHEPLTSRNRSPFKWRHHQHHHNRIHLSSYQRINHLLIRTMVVSHIVVIIVRMGVTKMMMLRFDIMEQRRRLRLHIIAMILLLE